MPNYQFCPRFKRYHGAKENLKAAEEFRVASRSLITSIRRFANNPAEIQ
jgi:hypothetical protein